MTGLPLADQWDTTKRQRETMAAYAHDQAADVLAPGQPNNQRQNVSIVRLSTAKPM
jgi:hypothetical protein